MRAIFLCILICVIGVAPAWGQPGLPDPSTGVIDGRVATLLWPARYRDAKTHDLLPVEKCVANFVPQGDLDSEISHPCGKWLAPKPGRYKVWVEGKGFISPTPVFLNYMGEEFRGRGVTMIVPVIASGLVQLAEGIHPGPNERLRLIATRTEFFNDWTAAFDRRVRDYRRPVAMPAGEALAGIFDKTTGDAVAVARPVAIREGKTAIVRPLPPERDSDVLVILRRPLARERENVQLYLVDDRGRRRPDVFLHATDTVLAIWYGATGRRVNVTAEADTLFLSPLALTQTPKRVTTYRGELRKKPRLEAHVLAPPGTFRQMSIVVRPIDSTTPLRTVSISPDSRNAIEHLPPEELRVTLKADNWTFEETVDLRDGTDGAVTFTLDPIVLRGTVYLGREPTRARIIFGEGRRDLLEAEADENGAYEAVFWREALYPAKVFLKDDEAEPYIDPAVPVERSRSFDFHLPDNRIAATVIDADSGLPVREAVVGITSEVAHDEVGAMKISHRYVADEEGKIVLPRLRPGRASIEASAPGYAQSEPQVIDVEAATKRDLRFALKRLRSVQTRVLLPGGSPAAGAEAMVVSDPTSGKVEWTGRADDAGRLNIETAHRSGIVIVRHRDAACRVLPVASVEERTVLLPADPTTVVIRTVDSTGQPVRFALLTVWLEGLRLCDRAAAFATWSAMPMTDGDGLWRGRNLPALPLRMLATRNVAPAQIATAAYDSLAQLIPYPRLEETIALRTSE